MYPLFRVAGTLEIWKLTYCASDYGSCARYKAAQDGRAVPANLLPNGRLLAKATTK